MWFLSIQVYFQFVFQSIFRLPNTVYDTQTKVLSHLYFHCLCYCNFIGPAADFIDVLGDLSLLIFPL